MGVSACFGLIVAVIDGVVLYLMDVPGAFVWAVLAFVTNFIPNIGFVIGVIPPALIALLEDGPGLMLAVIVVYSVVNFVIQSIIQPRVVGDTVGLSPTLTFLSLVFWTWLIGPLGALLAVPLSLLTQGAARGGRPACQVGATRDLGKARRRRGGGPGQRGSAGVNRCHGRGSCHAVGCSKRPSSPERIEAALERLPPRLRPPGEGDPHALVGAHADP